MSAKYIIENVEKLFISDKMKLLTMLVDAGVKISESADGCRINLDKLDQETLETINKFIKKNTTIPEEYKI